MDRKLDNYLVVEVDGKPTFAGAYESCYADISKFWRKEQTRRQYDRDFKAKIFPALPDHDHRAIDSYTKEDYDAAISQIAESGQAAPGEPFKPYAESTLQHFRHLIKVVVEAASAQGYCQNVLWGSQFSLPEEPSEREKVSARTKLKKSLLPKEESLAVSQLMRDPAQCGQHMGLLMMLACGLRNNEACGVNYGDVKPIGATDFCLLWVYKSTMRESNALKSGGKTPNADRLIPMPALVVDFLEKRKTFLQLRGYAEEEIARMPIACVGDQYSLRCASPDLTAAGREVLRQIKLNATQLAQIDAELANQATAEVLAEKDPTAYLLRRNFATHLSLLGLTESEIQYVLGHEIESGYEARNEFVNEEKLLAICHKMARRPFLNPPQPPKQIEFGAVGTYNFAGEHQSISVTGPFYIHLTVQTSEPGIPLNIQAHISGNDIKPLTMQIFQRPSLDPSYPRSTCANTAYQRLYAKHKSE